MSTLLSLGLCLLGSVPLEQPVSLTVRAAPVSRVLAEVSKASGVNLRGTPSVAKDVMILSVKDKPLKVVMAKVAENLHARWEKYQDAYLLVRTAADAKDERDAERKWLEAGVTAATEIFRKKPDPAMTEPAALAGLGRMVDEFRQVADGKRFSLERMKKLQGLAPAYRALRRILALMPADALIPEGNRCWVYAETPTKMQREFPISVGEILSDYQQDQKLWANAAEQTFSNEKLGTPVGPNQQAIGPRGVGKVLFKVQRDLGATTISTRLLIFDRKGFSLGEASLPLQAPINFSKLTVLHIQGQRKPDEPMPAELRNHYSNPASSDPLSLLVTDGALSTGSACHSDVVACLPDNTWIDLDNGVETVGDYWQVVRASCHLENKDGWLQIRPWLASEARQDRLDRKALGNLIAGFQREGRLSLANQVAFVNATKREEPEIFSFFYLAYLFHHLGDEEVRLQDWNALRIYAGMTPVQTEIAKAQRPVDFQYLSSAQLGVLQHVLFDSLDPYLKLEEMVLEREREPGMDTDYGFNLRTEPTEFLGNGITSKEMMWIDDVMDYLLVGLTKERSGFDIEDGMNPVALATNLFENERPDLHPWMKDEEQDVTRKYSAYRLGQQRQVRFRLHFGGGAYMALEVRDKGLIDRRARALGDLPYEVRKRVYDGLERLRAEAPPKKGTN